MRVTTDLKKAGEGTSPIISVIRVYLFILMVILVGALAFLGADAKWKFY